MRLADDSLSLVGSNPTPGAFLLVKLEEKVWVLGKMLGYDVEKLGHKVAGEARPDAIFISNKNPRYAILVDAKSTEGSYRLGTTYRALTDYVNHEFVRLEKRGG